MASSFFSGALAGFLGFLGFGGPPEPPTAPDRPVSAPVVASAASGVRGTIVLVHGGGWRGPDSQEQQRLVGQPGELLVKRGWRVVSVDYKKGQAGLQDVLDTVGQELARPNGGLLCLYGESAGAQLALVAAARQPAVDCVIAAGAPTDFQAFLTKTAAALDRAQQYVADTIRAVFGDSPQATAPWEPVHVANAMEADVLLLRQADDIFIPPEQVQRFRAVRPATQSAELEAGDASQRDQIWLHGSLSANGRSRYVSAIAGFVDRAVAAQQARRSASRTRCAGANRRIARIGVTRFRRALRCLARRSARASRVSRSSAMRRTTTTQILGEVTAARAWAALRRTRLGRRQLGALAANRARASVRIGAPSQLVVSLRGSRAARRRAHRR
jgi:acetyl esterase/lipase